MKSAISLQIQFNGNQLNILGVTDLSVINIEPLFLNSLKELILLITVRSEVIKVTRAWPHLQILQLDEENIFMESNEYGKIVSQIVDGVERGLFPTLETFRYSGHDISSSDLFKLHKANISVEHITNNPYI